MDINELINKHKNKALNAVIILLILYCANYIFNKQNKVLESLKKKNESEISKNNVLEGISILERKIDSYKDLLGKKDASYIMNTLSNIAKESGIKIISIRPSGEQVFPEFVKLPFDLIVSSADYHALGKFISRIEDYQDVYMVENIDISPDRQKKELSVNLTISSIAFKN